MSRSSRVAIFATVLALSLSVAVPAMAIVARWERVIVTLHEEPNGDILLVSGHLPGIVELPANVVLAAPAGSKLQWAGEILGGPVAEDPEVKPSVTTSGGATLYSFTLTKSRIAQLELTVPKSYKPVAEGTAVSLVYPVPANTPEVVVSARIPQAASVVNPAAGARLGPASSGYAYYQRKYANVKAGTDVGVSFTYTTAAKKPASGSTTGAAPKNNLFATVAFAIIAVLLVYLIAHYFKRRPPVELAEELDDEEQPEEPSA